MFNHLSQRLIICAIILSEVQGILVIAEGEGNDKINEADEIRKKRAATEPTILGLTQAEHDKSLELHNHYRRLIKASNMEKMVGFLLSLTLTLNTAHV